MPLDIAKLAVVSTPIDTELNPRNIFSILPGRKRHFQYLRDVQAEVLKAWFERRTEKDLVLKMNTGSGKTAVGLLILKSSLNEKCGPAVYVVPDIYLTQQVLEEAQALGIEATVDEKSLRFLKGKAILITNIYKLINGKSVFGVGTEGTKTKIGTLVIDDVHACLSTTEDQFTLSVSAGHRVYQELWNEFGESLKRQYQGRALEVEAHIPDTHIVVPYWIWQTKLASVEKCLHDSRDDADIKFVWPLIKKDLALCQCVFGGGRLEISPNCLPIAVIPSFCNAKRRIFMSATLSDDSVLVSHFDVKPDALKKLLVPSNANDIGDRLIIVPQEIWPDLELEKFKDFLASQASEYNVVVIVPSNSRARSWADVAHRTLTSANLQSGVQELKDGHVGLVVLVNKYDGIDLPGDACRILVLDGLPDARRQVDKIKQIILAGTDESLSMPIQRIEQGMGRGIRSNDDHCVVFLLGHTLTAQLCENDALAKFSSATRAQMELSSRVADQLREKDFTELKDVMDYCLSEDEDWLGMSRGVLVNTTYSAEGAISTLAICQREAFNAAESKDYSRAISVLQDLRNATSDTSLRGWLKQ